MPNTASPPLIDGFDSRFAEVNGVRLHYWIGGDPDGQPVVLWHGFLSTGYAWRHVAPALADAGLAVLVPDMRGYGDSDKPPGVEGYDARALANEARALVAQIGFGRRGPVVHAAHDMGALPALLWTADHRDEVKALLYIEAPSCSARCCARCSPIRPRPWGRARCGGGSCRLRPASRNG